MTAKTTVATPKPIQPIFAALTRAHESGFVPSQMEEIWVAPSGIAKPASIAAAVWRPAKEVAMTKPAPITMVEMMMLRTTFPRGDGVHHCNDEGQHGEIYEGGEPC